MSRAAFVLDASAVLCFLFGEAGTDRVRSVIGRAVLSSVNYTEVLSTLVDRGVDPETATRGLENLDVPVIHFDRRLAVATAFLRPRTRQWGLSLGDRACLALAHEEGAVALTADRAWSAVSAAVGIEIELIR